MPVERIQDRARGRWRGILDAVGVDPRYLTGKHGPCPICNGGKDRFRFDDKGGDGTFFCTHCGAGNGVDLVMKIRGVAFVEAKRAIEGVIGVAPVIVPKVGRNEEQQRDQMAALWQRASRLDGDDLASRYLRQREVELEEWPTMLRYVPDLPHWSDGNVRTLHPAMLAKFVAPDGRSAILHRTYLAEPGVKAKLPGEANAKSYMPGKVPARGAVRLAPAAETLGIAEGVETALSASILFSVPVWASLTTGSMVKWEPPPEARNLIIFGDRDDSFAGQNAAFALAYRLRTEGRGVEVRIPDPEDGSDWNDVLTARRVAA